ncbi:MAG TPA: response regulator transcription factor [Methylomirabilota bacterium]|nr:response regulator transcription factor [Methylomirabilota bacterium]
MKLLLIEDNKALLSTIKEELAKDYIIETASSGKDGDYLLHVYDYDLIILDINLPDMDGIALCQTIRKDKITTPILMMTGELKVEKKVTALDTGADDYITKPFNFSELKARIRALLRRQSETFVVNTLTVGDLQLDLKNRTVQRGELPINLNRKELQILEYFMRNRGKIITRSMILEHAWDSNFEPLTNVVDVHIKYLRDHIDKNFSKKLIKTIYGMGYKLEV